MGAGAHHEDRGRAGRGAFAAVGEAGVSGGSEKRGEKWGWSGEGEVVRVKS